MEEFFVYATDERDNLYFEFLLKTGAREREETYIEWTDMTKTGKSRRVELERGLADRLAVTAFEMMARARGVTPFRRNSSSRNCFTTKIPAMIAMSRLRPSSTAAILPC